jgi:hypothetical protein
MTWEDRLRKQPHKAKPHKFPSPDKTKIKIIDEERGTEYEEVEEA